MRTIIYVKLFIDACPRMLAVGLLVAFGFAEVSRAEWKVDFSRRVRASREAELNLSAAAKPAETATRAPASVTPIDAAKEPAKGILDTIFDSSEPIQDVVILHTNNGFVPSTVRVRKDGRYRVHVVNVNDKEKNVSFILDGFSEHHATYYGQIKIFALEPKKEGAYSFQSPETSSEGQIIVFNPETSVRVPASAGGR